MPLLAMISAVHPIESAKISLNIVFLSFNLSAQAENPNRPPALKIALMVEIIQT